MMLTRNVHPKRIDLSKSCEQAAPSGSPAFTLIEVLVVVAIIALLIAILMPSLNYARYQARLTSCQSTLHQLGIAVISYSSEQKAIPHGPDVQGLPPYLEPNDGTLSTSQIWTGPQEPMKSRMALGLLLRVKFLPPRLLYCPDDNSNDPVEELDKIVKEKISPAYCSYLYRQLHETSGRGSIESLGYNTDAPVPGQRGRPATALAMDMNSLITVDPSFRRTNHLARKVNILYHDASVQCLDNGKNLFSIRDEDLADTRARRRELLINADRKR